MVSLAVPAAATIAFCRYRFERASRGTPVIARLIALYLDVIVLGT